MKDIIKGRERKAGQAVIRKVAEEREERGRNQIREQGRKRRNMMKVDIKGTYEKGRKTRKEEGIEGRARGRKNRL